ncbi:Gfo/Idh/MocA family protein [Aridibaculum aurantiacum]|uniref:Gfo/Idh/MocA family protein n=1 Tax=Aridibaculum aurantiacum TaxID=2810307 RepID=UPI001A97CB27|nr:Gfo/Idh/MocA family oxidoreductase [Aridibaculum aurantiacum]
MINVSFSSPSPKTSKPIYIIGAGGIVNEAHLPAYKLAGFTVAGIYDINVEKAKATADKHGISKVFSSLQEMIAHASSDTVYDVALPGSALVEVLEQLPHGAAVLMQKPMGNDLAEAKRILAITREKKMIAAVNFQLRYAPFINAARDMIVQGLIGELVDIEVNENVYTPWHKWDFLFSLPRVEILYHSIHFVDVIRSFMGNPTSVYAKTIKHPLMNELASVRSNIILDYGDRIRANILTNHTHQFGLHNQQSYIMFEGTRGAIKIRMGLLMAYPEGVPDVFEYVLLEEGSEPVWKTLEIDGKWFPHAFIGSMAQVILAAEGTIQQPCNSVEDCIYTMACVEAAYTSSEKGGTPLEKI